MTVKAGDNTFALLSLSSGSQPEVKVEDSKVVVGGQTISFVDGHISFGTILGPPKISQ